MTRVLYEPKDFHIRIEGHAGSAPKGEDLVCAGVSALGFAMLLAAGDYDADVVTDEQAGVMDVRCKPEGPFDRALAETMLDTIAGGLELLAGQYPECVSYEEVP